MGKLAWLFGGVFGVVGVGLLAGALIGIQSLLAFRSEAESVPGTVVDFDAAKPVVEFVDRDGVPHRVRGLVSSNPPAYERGEGVTVRYRPGEPEGARIDGLMESWFLPMLLGGLGGIFTSIAGAFVISEIRSRRRRTWLEQFGMRVEAKYTGVRLDTGLRINGRHPWRLTAQWQNPATSLVHSFESDPLFYDPSEYVQRETVEVLVDAQDPSRHHVDTSFLPKHADG